MDDIKTISEDISASQYLCSSRSMEELMDDKHEETMQWNFDVENINVEETVEWLINSTTLQINLNPNWMVLDKKPVSIHREYQFCQEQLLQKLLSAKNIFEELDPMKLSKARARANSFETLRSAFFMNRAALKIANIDAATNFMFSDIDRNQFHRKSIGPYYFADVCAGPGGFSEYMFWRKGWLFKGFGLTLRGKNDFKLSDSTCASEVSFQSLYGIHNDGNACCPENILDFSAKVKHQTEKQGVHFMMADGGFSVEGNENLQEILSKPLYAAQCLIALSIVRTNGHFVTKLFDLLTPFSVALIYLMYKCFHKVAIFKPNASRPANAERYLICYGLKNTCETIAIKNYLMQVVQKLWELKDIDDDIDVNEIIPVWLLKKDEMFTNYVTNSNIKLAQKQIIGLLKLATFCRNPHLKDPKQEELRQRCLTYWRIPDRIKSNVLYLQPFDLVKLYIRKPEFMNTIATKIKTRQELSLFLSEPKKWQCVLVTSSNENCGYIFVSVGSSKVFRYHKRKWIRTKGIKLIKGTILYGEIVPENQIVQGKTCVRHSLQVIDALRLGDTSLADFSYKERMDLIYTYCSSINQEVGQSNILRVRPKVVKSLNEVNTFNMEVDIALNQWQMHLPALGYETQKEYFVPKFLLLLKTSEEESFNTTYILRLLFDFNLDANNENICSNFKQSFTNFMKYIDDISCL